MSQNQDGQDDDILFNLELQIEDDKTDNIIIRENDDIEEVVDKFCKDNNYGENIRKIIMNQIVGALDQNIEDLENDEEVEEIENDDRQNDFKKADSDEEYEKFMNNHAENILTTETYDKIEKKTENAVKIDEDEDYDNRCQSPEFVNYRFNTEYVEDNSEYAIQTNSQLENSNFHNNNKTVNFNQEADSSHINKVDQSNFTNIVIPTTPRETQVHTPKSENSFSHYIEKEKPRVRDSKKNSMSKNYNTASNIENSNQNISEVNSTYIKNKPQRNNSRLSATPDKLPGERLYNQYMDKLPKKREHSKRIIEERRKSELKEVKSRPSIDRMSDKMASNSPIRKAIDKVEDRLINYGEKKRERLTDEMTKKKLVEYDFSYHPSVGEKSQILATIKRKQRLDTMSKTQSSYLNKTYDATNNFDEDIESDEELRPLAENKLKGSFMSSNNTFTNLRTNTEESGKKNEAFNKNSKTSKTVTNNNYTNSEKNQTNTKNMKISGNKKNESNIYESFKTFSSKNEMSIKTPSRSKSKKYRSRTPLRKDTSASNISRKEKEERPRTPLKINPDKSIHDYLYVESKMIKVKKKNEESEHMKKVYPFKPTLSGSVQKLVTRKETENQFISRLVNSKKESEELIVNLKTKTKSNQTSQFKPTVGRGPKNPKTREVTVNLDGYYDKKLLSNQIKVKEDATISNLEKKKIFMEKSMNSILKMKIERYKQIFDMLDSDADGYISSRNIRLSALDSEMLKMLTPVLENIQKNNLNMNFKEFCLSADQFLSVKIFNGIAGGVHVKK